MTKRVTGLGGFFFKTPDVARLKDWYAKHLGIPISPHFDGWAFEWRDAADPEKKGSTLWSLFDAKSAYFDPSPAPFMCNFRVENLDEVLALLNAEGVKVDPAREDSDFGRFAWVYDPDGNKIELWEPPTGG